MFFQISDTTQLRDYWITPQKQLKILLLPVLTKRLNLKNFGSVPELLIEEISQSAIRCILKPVKNEKHDISSLLDIIVKHQLGPIRSLSANLINWYVGLERIGALPDEIPSLPPEIHKILTSPCPIDNSRKTEETHLLYLIPSGSLSMIEKRINAYGKQVFQGENPLQFRYFLDEARWEHAERLVDKPRWILITKDILPGSLNQPYKKQIQIITELNEKSSLNYQVPTLRETVTVIFLHKIATGEDLYQLRYEQNGRRSTYTYVAEKINGWRLLVGGYASFGLSVTGNYIFSRASLGMAAIQIL